MMKFSNEILAVLSTFLISSSVVTGFVVGNRGGIPAGSTVTTLYSTTVNDEEKISILPLPPSRKKGPFRGIRESISHLSNNQRFLRKRAVELGDVFLTNIFFQPTVVIGGREAVQEFVSGTELKAKVINPAFPDSFQELHTKWGSLNLDANDDTFKEARDLFASAFSRDALVEYTPVLNQEMDMYVENLKCRVMANPEEQIRLVPELKDLSLQMFSKIFSGEGLTEEQVQMFNDYNDALLALPFEKKKLERGRDALKTLKKEMLARYKKFPEQVEASNPASYYFQVVENRKGWEDEDRICTGMILFIWGAYIECASLMTNSLIAINKYNPEYVDIVQKEVQARDKESSPSDFEFYSGLDNTLGVLRESLRLIPPGGGTPRFSEEDFEFRGFRIPAGTAVIMDPRVGNTDPKLFTSPDDFKPSRWIPEKNASSAKCPFQGTALKLGFGSWFPGGFGAHQCPGIPLAELTSKIFLAKTVEAFDGWSFGDGTNKKGDVKFVEVPIKIPVDEFGVKFSLRN